MLGSHLIYSLQRGSYSAARRSANFTSGGQGRGPNDCDSRREVVEYIKASAQQAKPYRISQSSQRSPTRESTVAARQKFPVMITRLHDENRQLK